MAAFTSAKRRVLPLEFIAFQLCSCTWHGHHFATENLSVPDPLHCAGHINHDKTQADPRDDDLLFGHENRSHRRKTKGEARGVKKNQLMCARFTERTGKQMELQAPKQSESGASPLMFNTRSPSLCAKGGRAAQTRFVAAGLEVFAPHQ